MRNRYPKEWFASSVYKEFEGEEFPLPAGYDGYLRMVFGDYMQLPPEEQRQPSTICCSVIWSGTIRRIEGNGIAPRMHPGKNEFALLLQCYL